MAAMEGKSCVTSSLTDENERPLGANICCRFTIRGDSFLCDSGTKYARVFLLFFFFPYVANVWNKRRCVYTESGQANSFCDLHSGPMFNLQKKKNSYFYSAFHIFRVFIISLTYLLILKLTGVMPTS